MNKSSRVIDSNYFSTSLIIVKKHLIAPEYILKSVCNNPTILYKYFKSPGLWVALDVTTEWVEMWEFSQWTKADLLLIYVNNKMVNYKMFISLQQNNKN